MSFTYDKPYVESSVFIAYIRGEKKKKKGDSEVHDCKAIFDSILDAAKRGEFKIYTSTLTLAEVFKKKGDPRSLTEQENEDLRPYFREEYIQLIEVDRDIGERGNELCRTDKRVDYRKPLRPNDGVHVACAERAGCSVILAYDPDFSEYKHESIPVEWPKMLGQEEFRLTSPPEARTFPVAQERLMLGVPTKMETEPEK